MSGPIELLKELVRIPSVSKDEARIADFIEELFRGFSWKPVRTGNNVHAVFDLGPGPVLFLNSHTDTVPTGEGWSVPPLEALSRDGKIYGRGANDAKGCLAAMIFGVKAALTGNFSGTIVLAAVCEEEISGQGLEILLPRLPRPDAALVGEPTGLEPAVAQKGLVVLEVAVRGVSAHAAWGGGKNALVLAAKDILTLSDFTFDRPHPALGLPSLAVTQARGGDRHNVIPDRCDLVIDIRTTPAYAPEEIAQLVQERISGEVKIRSKRLVSVDTDSKEKIISAVLKVRPQAKPFGSPTLSDWVFLKGIPTVKIGPGDSRRSHTPDEFVFEKEILEGAAFYESAIREYFSNP